MRRIFIADAHLRHPDDHGYCMLLQFLNTIGRGANTLYIMGDLFEFWIGYRENPFNHYQPILDALKSLVAGGTRLVYFEGNHDFHLGPFFESDLKAEIHRGPAILDMEGRRVCCCHGDEINRRDYSYRLLRAIFHSEGTRLMSRIFPPAVAIAIAEHLGNASKKRHPVRRQKGDYLKLFQEYARQRFADGCDLVVSGHFHTPYEATESGKTMVCLGDWITQFTYGEWENGTIVLKRFSGAGG
jgi:UDP-2,3-diacylglucosamine hydrolase